MKTKIIAEIGINHNGSLDIAKKLIDLAKVAGCDFVKFQKRDPEVCVPDSQKNITKKTPWGEMKYIDYKRKIEFGKKEFDQIDKYCTEKGIKWFASVWDKPSVDFMYNYTNYSKIPSAKLKNNGLIKYARSKSKTLMISTGMSTEDDIEKAVVISNPDIIFHTNSTYPCPVEKLNLSYIQTLKEKYNDKIIGYSGHEFGLVASFTAVALGAKYIERHITLDRTMWGSDQLSSVEPAGLLKLVKGIRDVEKSLGDPGPRKILNSEKEKLISLRG